MMTTKSPGYQGNRDGFAMVTTLLIVLVLTVLALGAAWVASSEKKTSFAEGVHISSVLSADAGGEAAINFLRLSELPPPIVDFSNRSVREQSETTIHDNQNFEFSCRLDTMRHRLGWDTSYRDFEYQVLSTGSASIKGSSDIDLVASRLFRIGYN